MSSPLASAAGPITLVAGLAFAAVDTARPLAADRSLDRIAKMRETPFQVANDVAPGAILAGGSGTLVVGAFPSYVLFALGWVLFGIAGWKTRMFPAWAGAAFVVAGVLGFNVGLPPYGIPIGLAMAALGWWIHRSSRAPAAQRQAAA
jgi:hypothetical protein